MAIRIVRNNNGNCVTFIGSSQPAYWNSCLSGEVNDDDNTRVNVINDIRTTDTDNPIYEFFAVPYTEFQDADGNSFADATAAAAYITEKANVIGGAVEIDAATTIDFSRDSTLTSIVTSLGDSFAVNAIKAVAENDGTVSIAENISSGINLYEKIRKQNITIEGQTQAFALSAVVNSLNAFFTVTPVGAGADDVFDSFVTSSVIPSVSAFGDVSIAAGVATKGTNNNSQLNDGFYTSTQAISEPGEYFYFNNTGHDFSRKFIIGLLETSKFANSATLESISTSGGLLDLSVRLAPGAAYENSDYGVIIENGFYEKPQNSVIFRAGINSDNRLIIDHQKDGEWATIVRSAFPITSGEEYMLVCMMNKENSAVATSTVRSYQLGSSIILNYRYIESPDGSFYYPLFSDRDQADYVSQNANALFGGSYVDDVDVNSDGYYSHSHIFVDDESNTVWYMPDNYAFHDVSSAPTNTLDITYTAIPTAADSNYVPTAFSGSNYTFSENQSVNIQIHPADANFTTSVTGLPTGLTYSTGTGYITGTTNPVPADESYTITVTRSNAYGSSNGTFDINITDNASLGDLAGFTELAGNLIQPNRAFLSHDFLMQYDTTLSQGEEMTYSYTSGNNPPTIGILSSTGQTNFDAFDSSSDSLGSGDHDYATTSQWDLRYVSFGGDVGGDQTKHNLVGWSDNTTISASDGTNHSVTFTLEYGNDGYIKLYRGAVLLLTSASTFVGSQTITFAGFDDQAQTDLYVPSNLTIVNSSYGSTQPPTGFVNPLIVGQMSTSTLMGEAPDEDAAVQLTQGLKVNHRYIFPQTWIETNVLPHAVEEQSDMVFIGVPDSSANWVDVGDDDFDAFFRIQGTSSSSSYQSHLKTDSTTQDNVTINSLTDAYYDYALEWDGTDLHVIACNIGDINTQPGINVGGTFSRTVTESSYSGTGELDVVIGVDNGAQVDLSTSGLSHIRIPFGIRDILVGEWSNGDGYFAIQPTASDFDTGSYSGQHAPNWDEWSFSGVSTLNAGQTYRFIYHPSMEADDEIEFRLASDNTTVYTTGITTFDGTSDGDPKTTEGYKGIEFAVPTDAPPLTLFYINNTTADSGRAITISGSTYVVPITGITKEGPAANQTGTNVMDQYDHGWISLDEQLSAGERLVLDNAFFTDFLAEVVDTNTIFAIGIKGDNWVNTKEVNNATAANTGEFFKGDTYLVGVCNGLGTGVEFRIVSGSTQSNRMTVSTNLFSTICAFLDITSTGNNIRMGFGRNGDLSVTAGAESTVAYADWISYKAQTGAQGYGITSKDVVMSFWTWDGDAIDGAEIDWTGLSEVSIPAPAATLTTSWTKALDFSGSSERGLQVTNGTGNNPLRLSGLSTTASAPVTSGHTSSDGNARPWATAIVFSSDNNSSNQHIWNQGEGAGSADDNIYLRVDSSRNLYFGWGRSGALNECSITTLASGSGNWYGVYIASTGERLSGANASAANLADCFDIRIVNLSTGTVGSQLSTSSNWTSTGGRMDRLFAGDFTVGGRGSNRNFHGKVASMVITTLRRGVAMPTDAEITALVRDPQQWLTDYKVGNTYRYSGSGSDSTNFQLNNALSSQSTQVWLMGDGPNDAYSQIRNDVSPSTQDATSLNMISMVSNDIQTVSITGLT
jgi:hypothetical protein